VRITHTILLILACVTFSKVTAAELGSTHAGTDVARRATSIYEPVSSEINKADVAKQQYISLTDRLAPKDKLQP